MRNIIVITILLFVGQLVIQAQDLIIRKDGTEVQAKVLEVSSHIIIYTRFDNPDGPEYRENKNLILKIKYANGTEDVFVKNVSDNTYSQVGERRKSKVRYSGSVETAPFLGYNFEEYNNNDFACGLSLTTTHGIKIVDRYFVGMGIGVNLEFTATDDVNFFVPLYMTFRYDLSEAEASPFVSASLGAQFGSFDAQSYHSGRYYSEARATIGLWSNVMFGYRFKNKLYVAAGITFQNAVDIDYYDVDYYWDNNSDDWYSQKKVYEVIGLTVGVGIQF